MTKPSYAKPDRPYELTTEHCEWPLSKFVNLAGAGKEALEVSDEYWYSDSEIETKYLTEAEALGAFRIICSHPPLQILSVDMDTPDGTYVSMI